MFEGLLSKIYANKFLWNKFVEKLLKILSHGEEEKIYQKKNDDQEGWSSRDRKPPGACANFIGPPSDKTYIYNFRLALLLTLKDCFFKEKNKRLGVQTSFHFISACKYSTCISFLVVLCSERIPLSIPDEPFWPLPEDHQQRLWQGEHITQLQERFA